MDYRVEHLPLREVVVSQIRSMIIDGELPQGSRLVEGQLAERLGVSRNPVREAIRVLEATGLVDVVPRKGAYVCVIDPSEVRQIQELRLLVEGYAAEQAAMLRTDDHLKQLQLCLELGRSASKLGDMGAASTWHGDFHLALETAACNPFLGQLMKPLRHRTELVFTLVVDERGAIIWDDHEAIFNAVLAQDPEGSKKLVRAHISNALETFIRTVP